MKLLTAVREIKGIWWLVIAVEVGLALVVLVEMGAYFFASHPWVLLLIPAIWLGVSPVSNRLGRFRLSREESPRLK